MILAGKGAATAANRLEERDDSGGGDFNGDSEFRGRWEH